MKTNNILLTVLLVVFLGVAAVGILWNSLGGMIIAPLSGGSGATGTVGYDCVIAPNLVLSDTAIKDVETGVVCTYTKSVAKQYLDYFQISTLGNNPQPIGKISAEYNIGVSTDCAITLKNLIVDTGKKMYTCRVLSGV